MKQFNEEYTSIIENSTTQKNNNKHIIFIYIKIKGYFYRHMYANEH